MAIQRHDTVFRQLSAKELDAWREIPATIASDCMNRSNSMIAAIKPAVPGMRLCGQARTVSTMIADNSAIHIATSLALPGEILAIDAGADENVALWGGVLTHAARKRGVGGVVVDGAIRDIAEIRDSGFPCFCRAVVPRGPHKGFGGTVDGRISVGGVAIAPGDLLIGDDDGFVVVPLPDIDRVLDAAHVQLKKERDWISAIDAGRTTAELLDLPPPEPLSSR